MTVVSINPRVLKDCIVKFGATNEHQEEITSVTVTPSTSIVTETAVAPGSVYTDQTPATYTLDLEFLQDWETADSLANYLWANEGDNETLIFEPIAGGQTLTATVILTPGSIGGPGGAFPKSSVSLGISGKPVWS